MKVIKIKKSSIKKNPNAGETQTFIPQAWDTTVEYKGELPKFLDGLVHVISEMRVSNEEPEYELRFIEPPIKAMVDKLIKTKRACVNQTRDFHVIESMFPEPEYNYEYHNPLLTCSNCNSKVR